MMRRYPFRKFDSRMPTVNPKKLFTGASAVLLVLLLALPLAACGGGEQQQALPKADFEASACSGQVPLTICFTNNSLNAQEFLWDFGDGVTMTTTAADQQVQHEYTISGTHTVTLTATGIADPPQTATANASIEVHPGSVATVSIRPSPLIVEADKTMQLQCVSADEYGNEVPGIDVAGNMTWELLNDNAGSLANTGELVAGEVAGSYRNVVNVAVEQGDTLCTANSSLTITHGPLHQVVLAPDPVEIGMGMTQQFVAVGADRYGNRIAGLDFEWSTEAEAGAIDTNGLFTAGDSPGSYDTAITVEVTLDDITQSGSASVTVEPDRVAFISDRKDDQFDIYMIELDTHNEVQTTETVLDELEMSWSPDGRSIVVDIYVGRQSILLGMNDDGEWMSVLTEDAEESNPSWSPDGSRIAYVGWSEEMESYQLFVIDVDGGNRTQITSDPDGDVYSPEWSPDGTKLAYDFTPHGQNGDIYVIGADGSNPTRLTTSPMNDTWPMWSPDGKEIAYMSEHDGDYDVYVINADGSSNRNLTSNYGIDDCHPCWSLDGTKIVFSSDRDVADQETRELYIMDADGGNIERLTDNEFYDDRPQWAPRKRGVFVTEASVILPGASTHKPKTVQQVTAEARTAVVRIETDLGTGSGFFINSDGLIMTNNHVVRDAEEITVAVEGHSVSYEGVVEARDKERDLALIKIDVSDVPYLEFGDMSTIDLGEQVLILGYPLDKKKASITSGFVSSIEYDGGTNITFVQTDSAVNMGNSGGPLLNLQGDVIGVVAAKLVSVGVEGIGFAISANTVNTYLPKLLGEGG